MKQMDVALDPMAGCANVESYQVSHIWPLIPLNGIFAIDPGPEVSGWCFFVDGRVERFGVVLNGSLLAYLKLGIFPYRTLAIEMVASYGMPVGREVFETVLWAGRFMQASRTPDAVQLVYRKDVKMHLCGSMKAKDANIRQALIDLFPATGGGKTPQIGTKAKPGPLHGVTSHVWPALAVAVTVAAKDQA
jgi:hypothetical protein